MHQLLRNRNSIWTYQSEKFSALHKILAQLTHNIKILAYLRSMCERAAQLVFLMPDEVE
jgi:hypothetical protein